ncbi:unnamed protein product [Paramecium sonneborni]|uniref:DNA mismatch repair protein S5 domain-containing protein n=1 Tax=Paramecium sonneborni TaxID=65129 RepID=A0A8S1N1E3_9CILI|nr:unnamed protein product [Paramecium sonneborni]
MIKKLPQEVINKIAAGEVVQRPFSVIKEMVENSIDAHAQNITIYLNNAGLDLIRIIDNGDGIMKEDYELLCERYATSKIRVAEDLSQLFSFGFRGEALASISFVSEMTVISKRRDQQVGYKGTFNSQKLLSMCPIGCSDGTEIQIASLFYNLEKRREALNKSEEKKSILQLIQNLSLHHSQIQFKLFYENKCEFSSFNRLETISTIMKINQSCIQEKQFDSDVYKYESHIIFTKLSSVKCKREFCLFINDRLVECDTLKKKITLAYQDCYLCLRVEDGGYYVYLSIKLQPKDIDPNVHPNKKIVRFLNEDEISTEISEKLKQELSPQQTVKLVQTMLIQPKSQEEQKRNSFTFRQSIQSQQQYQKEKVRIDPKTQTLIQQFARKTSAQFTQNYQDQVINTQSQKIQEESNILNDKSQKQENPIENQTLNESVSKNQSKKNQISDQEPQIIEEKLQIQNQSTKQFKISLNAQLELFNILQKKHHKETCEFYKNISFVGLLQDQQQLLVQNDTQLCLINMIPMIFNMFIVQIMQGEQPEGVLLMERQQESSIRIICQDQQEILFEVIENDVSLAIQIAEQLSLLSYNIKFIRDFVMPFFKKYNVSVIKNEVQVIVRLEHLYKYFERC